MEVWTAPISTELKLICIGTVQVTLRVKKIETWAALIGEGHSNEDDKVAFEINTYKFDRCDRCILSMDQ